VEQTPLLERNVGSAIQEYNAYSLNLKAITVFKKNTTNPSTGPE
jgi:hypothetical protein